MINFNYFLGQKQQKPKLQRFQDRADVGRQLAQMLDAYAEQPDVLVLGLARGGVPVAYEIAAKLHLPLDALIVRKLGLPSQPELAMGAIASGGIRVLNAEIVESLAIPQKVIDAVAKMETDELNRREQTYRGTRPFPNVSGKTVILVDDGIATGSTLRAAIAALRTKYPARIVVAVGVSPPETYQKLIEEVDKVVCLLQPIPFVSVGYWFERFGSTSDGEVRMLLSQAMGSGYQKLTNRLASDLN